MKQSNPILRKAVFAVVALLLLFAVALACRPAVQREHHRLVLLRNQVEAAAAPDEPVIVTDALLAQFLRWRGSSALRRQLYRAKSGRWPEALPKAAQEVVIVTTDNDPFLATLRANGYVLTPDSSQQLTIERGNAVELPGRGLIRIYFAARSHPAPLSSH